MKTKVYIDGQNFLYKAAEILIEAGSIESKNDLTRIDIRKLIGNIFGEVDTIEYYGAKEARQSLAFLQIVRNYDITTRSIRCT